jgi:hypothetical protein
MRSAYKRGVFLAAFSGGGTGVSSRPRSAVALPLLAATAAVLLATLAAGCGERHHLDNHLWTLFDIQAQLQAGGNVGVGPSMPDGVPASALMTDNHDGTFSLKVIPAFSEGAPAAYVTTDIWVNYDEDDVWPQQLFVQMADADHPLTNADGSPAPVLVDVGPKSTFYSPFWQYEQAVVGPGTDPDHFRSVRDLLDAALPTTPAANHTAPLRPLSVVAAPAGQPMVEPTWQTPLDTLPAEEAWLDGTKLGIFDFGTGLFEIDEDELYVEPIALFVFVGADGTPTPGALWVAGVGDLFSGEEAEVNTDPATGDPQPQFGGFWRLDLAALPGGAGPFDVATHAAAAPAGVDLKDYQGRVALDVSCFDAPTFPTSCTWLDSQASIEDALGAANITETEIMQAAPLVFYDKKPVKR